MPRETLTHRERWLRTMRRQPVDRVPDLEFSAWQQTIARWRQEGMDTQGQTGGDFFDAYFGTDSADDGPGIWADVGLLPAFEPQVLEERGSHQIILDGDGALAERLNPELGASIPRYIRHAIENRADWERLRDERLDPAHPGRVARYPDALARRLRERDYPLNLYLGSIYGWIRNWVGVERLSLLLYDDRPLVEEMMEHLTRLTLSVLEQYAGRGIEVDYGAWWEDMCYNHGSLISPRMFTELMVPRYKRITDFTRQEFGVQFHQLDCDGNIHQLVGPWLQGGINVMFPIEVAHTDAYRIARDFGTRVVLRGAFDKRALIEGPAAIDAEIERLRPLLDRGGFIPHTDHLVPPDVPFEHYLYYRRKKCEWIGKEWREPGLRRESGFLTHWRLLGPFDNTGNRGFDMPLGPELDPESAGPFVGKDGRELGWRTWRGNVASGYVDLAQVVSCEPCCVAYAACELCSPGERDGWLELGSGDGLRVWWNGQEVWTKDVYRGAAPAQDLVPVHVRRGKNQVLLKVAQIEGDWGFYFRLTDDHGRCWRDIEVQTSGGGPTCRLSGAG